MPLDGDPVHDGFILPILMRPVIGQTGLLHEGVNQLMAHHAPEHRHGIAHVRDGDKVLNGNGMVRRIRETLTVGTDERGIARIGHHFNVIGLTEYVYREFQLQKGNASS